MDCDNRFVDYDNLGNVSKEICGSRLLWFLTEVSDGGRDALRGYSKKMRSDIPRYFSLW